MPRSKGAAARAKGHAWEREVAYEHLAPIFGEVRRGRQSREGHDEADVVLPSSVPFWPECESAKRCDVRGKLQQAVEAAAKHLLTTGMYRMPVAILKDTHKGLPGTKAKPAMVVMQLPDFLELVKQWWGMKQGGIPMDRASTRDLDRLRALAQEMLEAIDDQLRDPAGPIAHAQSHPHPGPDVAPSLDETRRGDPDVGGPAGNGLGEV